MLIKDALPPTMVFTVRVAPWDTTVQLGGGSGGGLAPQLSFSIARDEFTQEGPSGPIEAKRVLLLKALPLQKSRVRGAAPPTLPF